MVASLYTRRNDRVKTGARLDVIALNLTGFGDADFEDGTGFTLWTCPPGETYRLHYFAEVHDVPTGTASVHTIMPERLQGVEAHGAGDDLLTTALSLRGADDTVQAGVLHASTASGAFDFGGGDRLGIISAATDAPDSTAGLCISVVLVPIHRSRYSVGSVV